MDFIIAFGGQGPPMNRIAGRASDLNDAKLEHLPPSWSTCHLGLICILFTVCITFKGDTVDR